MTDTTERKKRDKYRMSLEQRQDHNQSRNDATSRRYWYMVNEMGVPRWKARLARTSVLTMKSYFPDHAFPPDLVELKPRGPKLGAKYDLTSQRCTWEVVNDHGAVVYDGLYKCEAELIAKNHRLDFRMRAG